MTSIPTASHRRGVDGLAHQPGESEVLCRRTSVQVDVRCSLSLHLIRRFLMHITPQSALVRHRRCVPQSGRDRSGGVPGPLDRQTGRHRRRPSAHAAAPRSSWPPSTPVCRSATFRSPPDTPTRERPPSTTDDARTSTATPPTSSSPSSQEPDGSLPISAGPFLSRQRVRWRRTTVSPRDSSFFIDAHRHLGLQRAPAEPRDYGAIRPADFAESARVTYRWQATIVPGFGSAIDPALSG